MSVSQQLFMSKTTILYGNSFYWSIFISKVIVINVVGYLNYFYFFIPLTAKSVFNVLVSSQI